jgi:hypothetical protein
MAPGSAPGIHDRAGAAWGAVARGAAPGRDRGAHKRRWLLWLQLDRSQPKSRHADARSRRRRRRQRAPPAAPVTGTELAAEWREFAAFIGAAELDALPHKRPRALAKRAKVGASGSSDALRVRLHSFAQPTATPPAWFAIEPQGRLENLAAKQALRVALPSADRPTGTMTVNQHLDCGHDRSASKMGGPQLSG